MLYQAENPTAATGMAVPWSWIFPSTPIPWARRPPSAGRRLPPRGGWTGIRTPSAGS